MLATFVLALVASFVPAQEPTAPATAAETYDLRCTTRVGEPVYVTTRMTTKGSLRVRRGSSYVEVPYDRSVAIEHLDEFTSFDQPNDGDFLAARRYVKWHVDDRKRVRDPEWNGVWMRLGVNAGEGTLALQERGVRKSVFEQELARVDYVGAWLPLPQDARLGGPVRVDPLALGHLLHFVDGKLSGKAALVLESIGADRVATISGLLAFTRKLEDEGADEIHRGTCTLNVDLNTEKLTRVLWKGELELVDRGQPQRYSGKVPFKCELNVQLGDAAKKSGSAKSVQRDRDWQFEAAKLDFELPSHWFDYRVEDPMLMVLGSALYGVDEATELEFKLIDVGKGGADMTMDSVLDAWRSDKSFKLREERSTTCALGRGKVLRIENAEKNEIWIGLFPCGEHWLVRIRLIAPPNAGKDLAPTWTKLEKSLRRPK